MKEMRLKLLVIGRMIEIRERRKKEIEEEREEEKMKNGKVGDR